MIIQLLGKRRELIVINDHSKTFGTMLTDKRLDNRECLTTTRSTDYPCSTKGVDDIDPSFAELAFVIIPHRNVHTIFIVDIIAHLLKTLVLKIEAVFQKSILQILGDVVKSNVAKHCSDNRHDKIQPCTTIQSEEIGRPMLIEHPYGQEHQDNANRNRINDHLLGIELQMFLVSRADAGYADNQQRHHLTMKHMAILIHIHQFNTVMYVHEDATPMIQHIGVYGILEELNYE